MRVLVGAGTDGGDTPSKHTEVIELLNKAGAKSVHASKVDPPQPSLSQYIGTYRNDEGQELGVTVEEGQLTLARGLAEASWDWRKRTPRFRSCRLTSARGK